MHLINKYITRLFIFSFFLTFFSCEKCMTCTSKNNSTGAIDFTYPESCGRKATLDAQELNYRVNLADSLTLDCTRD